MIKIIRHREGYDGVGIYRHICDCGCEFEYGKEDVTNILGKPFRKGEDTIWVIKCPDCNKEASEHYSIFTPVRYE